MSGTLCDADDEVTFVDMTTAMDLTTPRGWRDLTSSQTGTREHFTLSVG